MSAETEKAIKQAKRSLAEAQLAKDIEDRIKEFNADTSREYACSGVYCSGVETLDPTVTIYYGTSKKDYPDIYPEFAQGEEKTDES